MCIGSVPELWCKAYGSHPDHVALLACVAANNFHACAEYQWFHDGDQQMNEIYPLLYTSKNGTYMCRVIARGQTLQMSFHVKGTLVYKFISQVIITSFIHNFS